MIYAASIRAERFAFASLAEVFAKANEVKSGDQLAGIAAQTEGERVAAKLVLADLPLAHIHDNPLLDPAIDEVSRLCWEALDAKAFAAVASKTVGELREHLLDDNRTAQDFHSLRLALLPEMAAAVAKIMSNKDLIYVASRIRNVTRCRNTMGQPGVLGIRVQPNHPADDLTGILFSAIEGLLLGSGDAVIGVNPATDSVDSCAAILRGLAKLIEVSGAPTQSCCLAHITTQLACLEKGAPIDLLFQSITGTEKANASFGVSASLLGEGREKVLEHHQGRPGWVGSQVMYFETGQGSALSAEAHHGIDQLTLEARAHGFARLYDPFLVNSVVGFIGPEYLYDERQIIRAGLEDHFVGKLLGLPMGCDVCYTNHAKADQNSADNLMFLLAAAGCNYFMGVPCADDVMLNYQSTSYHDALVVRQTLGLRPAPEFEQWLSERGIWRAGRLLESAARERLLESFIPLLDGMAGEALP